MTQVHVPNFGGLSGSEDRGGGDNSIQFINIGRVGDESSKELQQKNRGWKQYFDFSYITGSTKNATLKNCILGNFFCSYL